jgi:hypothetical protein
MHTAAAEVAAVKVVGVLLIVLGIVALAVGGFQYTTREKIVDLGPIEATQEKERTVPLPPIAGVAAIVGGIVLVAAGSRTRA